VPEQVKIIRRESERLAHLLHFFDKTVKLPETCVLRNVRVAAAELVVINKLNALLRQKTFHTFKIVVIDARAAVQQQQFYFRIVADSFCPNFEFSFWAFYFYHFYSAALYAAFCRPEVIFQRNFTGMHFCRSRLLAASRRSQY